jgi:hypothetical protein
VLTRDLDRAKFVYTDVLGGSLLHEDSSALTGTRNAYIQVGEIVVELATPTREDTLAAEDMQANGQIHHAAAWKVRDLDQAEKYLQSKGIETLERDESTILSKPATTHGANFRWTTQDVPGRS